MSASGAAGPRTVVVFGATGRQGGGLVRALAAANARAAASGAPPPWRVVAVSRTPSAPAGAALAAAALPGVELARADANDRASLDALLAATGPVAALFAVTNPFAARWNGPAAGGGSKPPPSDVAAEEAQGRHLIAAAAAASPPVAHFVLASAAGADDPACDVPTIVCKGRLETAARAEGAAGRLPALTILAPGGFYENMQSPFAGIKQGSVPGLTREGVRLQMVCAADVGAIAAKAIAEGPATWAGVRMDLAGDDLTPEEMAATLSRLRGGERWRVTRPPGFVLLLFIPAAVSTLKKYLETKTARVDIAAVRAAYPELLSFEGWCRQQGFDKQVFASPNYCTVQ